MLKVWLIMKCRLFLPFSYIIACATLGIFIAWFMLHKNVDFSVRNIRVENILGVQTKIFQPGSIVVITREVCSTGDVHVIAYRDLIGTANIDFALPSSTRLVTRGCKIYKNTVNLPETVPNGDYIIRSGMQYQARMVGSVDVYFPEDVAIRIDRVTVK